MNTLLTEIKQCIVEEMGVADEVSKTANNIVNTIVKDSKQSPYTNIKKGSINYNFLEKNIHVYYTLYYVNSLTNVDIMETGSSFKTDENIYTLNTTIVYSKEDNKYFDYKGTTQHELDHIYKMIKSNKNLLYKNSSLSLYNKADKWKKHQNLTYKCIGYIFYYNNKFERDAFINSIYKQIMDNPTIDPYVTLQNTTTYSNIQFLKRKIVEQNYNSVKQEFEPVIKKEFNKSFNWFYKLTKKLIDDYIFKMARLLIKVNKELNIIRYDENGEAPLSN